MKELSVEKKAKRYDEAIKRIENIKTGKCETTFMFTEGLFEHIFPELKESEDERIRKELITHCRNTRCVTEEGAEEIAKWIAWLEKQGEKTNPYSGISFEHNGHIWGMCARDNGVDILFDRQLFNHLEKKVEPKFKVGDWVTIKK